MTRRKTTLPQALPGRRDPCHAIPTRSALGAFGFKMTYSEKLKDPRWQKLRLQVMERDGWKCRDCGDAQKTLQVHHCLYNGEPWEAKPNHLLTLCEDCHRTRQDLERDGRLMIGQISGEIDVYSLETLVRFLAQTVGCKRMPIEEQIRWWIGQKEREK
jgi:5-methylcytosine-specific restriction endonuclease McrA